MMSDRMTQTELHSPGTIAWLSWPLNTAAMWFLIQVCMHDPYPITYTYESKLGRYCSQRTPTHTYCVMSGMLNVHCKATVEVLRLYMAKQGPLLANYSQSFIEQLRNASSPYANSTAGLRRQLPFEDKSRLQRFLVWLNLALKKRMPWGAAAAQCKRKHVVICQPHHSLSCSVLSHSAFFPYLGIFWLCLLSFSTLLCFLWSCGTTSNRL